MKKNAITITAKSMLALTIATGALFVASSKRNKVSLVKADSPEAKAVLTIDPHIYWGNGGESYKVAAVFTDNDSQQVWSDLVSVNAPERFVKLSYDASFNPKTASIYRYAITLEEETWLDDPTANHYDEPMNVTFTDSGNHIILNGPNSGIFNYPKPYKNEYLPDSHSWESHDTFMTNVYMNSSKNTEYSVQVDLKENDLLIMNDPIFVNIREADVTYGDNMNPGELIYHEEIIESEYGITANHNFECKVEGIYNFAFDYVGNRVTVNKEVPPTPVDPEDPSDPDEPSGGDTPSEEPSEKGEGGSTSLKVSFKDILKIIAKTFRDAWNDLVAHIKRWFKLN